MTTADQLFELLEQGGSISMSQDLIGNASNASKDVFCNITDNTESRIDLNSFTLSYDEDSNANKSWTLFSIDSNAKLTIGNGLAGFGTLIFNLNTLNNNSAPCLFDLAPGATLVIERGVTIELNYPATHINKVVTFRGISDLLQYPGMAVITTTNGEVTTTRIVVTADTTIVGN